MESAMQRPTTGFLESDCNSSKNSYLIGRPMVITRMLKLAILFGIGMCSMTARSQQMKNTLNQTQPRVFVADSESWEMIGGWGASGSRNANGSGSFGGGGYTAGGARPQTAEIIKTFNQRCPGVTITNNVQKADFAVVLDHEGGKGLVHRRNKIAVFNRDGDVIFSDSTRELGNSVKDACQAIISAPPRPPQTSSTVPPADTPTAQLASSVKAQSPSQPNSDALLEIASTPSGADVELDGSFVGNTPSAIGVSPGDHAISVKKNGYQTWDRKIKISTGKVNISAELQAEAKQSSAAVAATAIPASDDSQQKIPAVAEEHAAGSVPANRETSGPSGSAPANLGTVYFASDPSGADVYVDDVFVGKSPITLNLKIGRHYVRTFVKDHKNWSQLITITPDADIKLTAKLEKSN
jgi:PEGA domain